MCAMGDSPTMRRDALCRDCPGRIDDGPRCPACGSPRIIAHPELFDLEIAHLDCDAFYASIEKRDDQSIRDRPVIVGGGRRGVVSTACYVARVRGVRSAMPMFKARRLCPDAVVVQPRMQVYSRVSRQIRDMMEELTPLVEPLSLDEAFLDLSGTARLHGEPPALLLARLSNRIEHELGLSASVGLSHNKFLAKVASDLDKPRGFSVIGEAETEEFLSDRPVSLIWGVGKTLQRSLEGSGIRTFSDLRRLDRAELARRYGAMGERLWHLGRGRDARRVSRDERARSLSSETTFARDTGDLATLDGYLWRLSERVADRVKKNRLAGRVVVLKVKRSDHRILTRQARLSEPTRTADRIYRTARALLERVVERGPFRLIGVGLRELGAKEDADEFGSLLDDDAVKRARAEEATDIIRERFGKQAIMKGRALR